MRYLLRTRRLRPNPPVLLLKHLWLFLALVLLVLAGMRARAAEPLAPEGVMERGEKQFRSLEDYQCVAEVQSNLGKRVETGAVEFTFKQPRMLRLKVIRGKRKGSEVAVDSRGQIRGRQGGLFKSIVKRMKADDPRLLTIRGTSMMSLDWGSFFAKYHAGTRAPGARVTLAPRADPDSPYEVVLTYPRLGRSIREVYTLDSDRWIIIEGAVYEDAARVEHVVFRDVKLNTGVADARFRL